MAEIINCVQAASDIREKIKEKTSLSGITPVLAAVRVGADPSDLAYERGIKNTFEKAGMEVRVFELDENISQQQLEEKYMQINSDPSIHSILLFRPLPSGLDERPLAAMTDPAKDADCMSPVNWAKLVMGDDSAVCPCTAEAVVRILDFANTDINGANAVIIGRSQVIGKPLGLMLLKRNATVTWCHSRTKDISLQCRNADILVSACGRARMIGEDIARVISSGCTAIDVGMNFEGGRMCGDFDFEAVEPYAGKITTVPGGVGSMTNTILALHTAQAALPGIDILS